MAMFTKLVTLSIVSLLLSGSRVATSLAKAVIPDADAHEASASTHDISPLLTHLGGRRPTTEDVCLLLILGAGLIGLQLRRTQRSAGGARVTV